MEKKYTVKKFVEEYDKLTTEVQRKSYIDKIKVLPYLSYALKQISANKIIKTTSTDENGNINVRSAMRKIFYVYTIIETYTDIKMSAENVLDEYDLLNERGIIKEIFKRIPEDEIEEFKTILDMEFNDFMTNYYEPHAFAERNIAKIINGIKDIIPKVQPILDKVKDMNKEELANLINIGTNTPSDNC